MKKLSSSISLAGIKNTVSKKSFSGTASSAQMSSADTRHHLDDINHEINTLIDHILTTESWGPTPDQLFRLSQYSNESFNYRLTILTTVFDRLVQYYDRAKKAASGLSLSKNLAAFNISTAKRPAEDHNDYRIVLKALVSLQFLLIHAPDDRIVDSVKSFNAHYGDICNKINTTYSSCLHDLDFKASQLIKKKSLDLLELLDNKSLLEQEKSRKQSSSLLDNFDENVSIADTDISSVLHNDVAIPNHAHPSTILTKQDDFSGSSSKVFFEETLDNGPEDDHYLKKDISKDFVTNTPAQKNSKFASLTNLRKKANSISKPNTVSSEGDTPGITENLRKTASSLKLKTSSLTASSTSLLTKGQPKPDNDQKLLLDDNEERFRRSRSGSQGAANKNKTRPVRGKSFSSLGVTLSSKLHRSSSKQKLEKEMLSGKKFYPNTYGQNDSRNSIDSTRTNDLKGASSNEEQEPLEVKGKVTRKFRSNSQPSNGKELQTQTIPINFNIPSNNLSSNSLVAPAPRKSATYSNPQDLIRANGQSYSPASSTFKNINPNNPFLSPLLENSPAQGHTTVFGSPGISHQTNPFLSPNFSGEDRLANNLTGNSYTYNNVF